MDGRHHALTRLLSLGGLAAAPLLVLGVFFVLPIGGMLTLGFWPDGSFDLEGVVEVFGRERVHRVLAFTAFSAVAGTVVTLVLGVPTAYVLYRLRFPGRRLLQAGLLVPFVLPTVVVGIAFRQLLAEGGPLGFLGLDGSRTAIVAALAFFNLAVVVRTVGAAWETLDPRPAQAAAALGASPLQVLLTVTLPQLRSAVVSAATVVFLFCATAYGVVLTLGGLRYSTIETEIYLLTAQLLDLRAAAALSVLQLLVVVVLLYAAHRARRAPVTLERRPQPAQRPSWRDLPAIAVAICALGLVITPIAGLVAGSFEDDGEWSLANYRRLDSTGSEDALLVPVTEAMRNSLSTAVDATWMSLLLGILVALVVTRRSHTPTERRMRGVLDGIFMLPLGVSAVTLGFGFLVTLDEPPVDFRDSVLIVPVAQALVALPLVVRLLVPVLSGIDDQQRQAAASLGAGPLRVLATIDLAVAWKPLLAAAGFAFAVSLGEFGATSFLARDESATVPVVIFQLLGHPGDHNHGMALAASVLLASATAVVVLAVERLRVPGVGGF